MEKDNIESGGTYQIIRLIDQIREILNEVYYINYMYGSGERTKMIISKCMDELITEYEKRSCENRLEWHKEQVGDK